MEKHRCFGCMGVTENTVCEKCGWPLGKNNEAHQLPVGTRLHGQYVIGRVLGQGGFGITYLGWDDYLDMPVAIKEFYPNAVVTRECTVSATVHCTSQQVQANYNMSKERFLREAKALARLRDVPEVVGVHGFFEENGTAYIIMEYVKGMDLATYISRKGGKLSPDETFRILRPVMEALDMVHQADLVHRDISPDNIMLHPRGGAKLLDFGAVRNVEGAEAGKDMAHSTEAILKHGFAPAEQYKSRGGLGPWSDEYAMCATVYYCLTGRIPPQAVERMLEDIPVEFDIPGLPKHQREALEKGMAIRAKDRHGSMRALMEALFEEKDQITVPDAGSVSVEPKIADDPRSNATEPRNIAGNEPESAPKAIFRDETRSIFPEQDAEVKNDTEEAPAHSTSDIAASFWKKALLAVLAFVILSVLVVVFLPRGWHVTDVGRVYYDNGFKRTNAWLYEGEDRFFFDSEGMMVVGWWVVDGQQYYFLDNGTMATGLCEIDGEVYYFGADGVMCTGLQNVDGKWFGFDESGKRIRGWALIDNDKFFFRLDSSEMVTGAAQIGEDFFYFSNKGVMQTGWVTLKSGTGEETFYFGHDGRALKGFRVIDGKRYYFESSGRMVTGLQSIVGKTYFFNGFGIMQTDGWRTISGKRYYFTYTGEAKEGFFEYRGKTYYFDEDGVMHTGWKSIQRLDLNSFRWVRDEYYFGTDGVMYTGSHNIDGRWYYFNNEGKRQ